MGKLLIAASLAALVVLALFYSPPNPGRYVLPATICGINLPPAKMIESVRGFDKKQKFVMERVLFGYAPSRPVVLIVRIQHKFRLVTVARFPLSPDKVIYVNSCVTKNTDEFTNENANYTNKIDKLTVDVGGDRNAEDKNYQSISRR